MWVFILFMSHQDIKNETENQCTTRGHKKKPSVKWFADGKLWGPTFLQLTVDSLLTVSS